MSKLVERVWDDINLSVNTKVCIYCFCVLSTLLYSRQSCATFHKQENRLNSFISMVSSAFLCGKTKSPIQSPSPRVFSDHQHPHHHEQETPVLERTHEENDDGRSPGDILYGELSSGLRSMD